MKRLVTKRLIGLLLPLLLPFSAEAGGQVDFCKTMEHAGGRYIVCSFDPAKSMIRIYDRDHVSGEGYRSFSDLSSALWRQHMFSVFAMNGGMYHSDYSPVGLFVENGVERSPIITGGGWGNFHLLPNGVFYLKGAMAGVLETQGYVSAGLKPDFATQSGPMLVIDGKLHPRFLPDSDSLKRRNGVGVSRDGMVHFAISENTVRFYDFATLFRDVLDAPNALYLDGTISSVDIPAMKRRDSLFAMGPIIAVVDRVPD
ncbi:phosphodiester glycosidase family protein [Agrobacterium tumefaciens]|uniref:Phosphodiester glycosidase family protein n=1 Tax=Agrobacterium tumefaciens TaxID=358 RepID=A0AA44JA47_AGRTU|nr:phosphodiester glycosidase family protein [Agrobacterium tumefaciens]NSL24972.1 phosphodiester glycosidase family protein [Agrobacterium tumefaciens]NTB86627.1 phosphodiester glycosidase family protein [Agrobacterium tumefaciens]NTC20955.1 phosphodiester glycosidase family protein [Agrobacterium tumefaciens]NTC30504.1 phosphodiester glycosidase family protein [Agrobacterium tumefaciens]NTC54142.1 phosphodiester glycosidase family protein [Agrobacterium tumefaciens]